MEVFQLSEQAVLLAERGILTAVPLPTAPSKPRAAASRIVNVASLDSESVVIGKTADCLRLDGTVLLRGSETSQVDAWLLAVPLSVHSDSVSRGKGSKVEQRLLRAPEVYTHVFPSPIQLADPSVAARAKGFLVGLLKKIVQSRVAAGGGLLLSSDEAKRLRDPHLLLHLQPITDQRAFASLCAAVTNCSADGEMLLPAPVVQSLKLILLSLQQSSGGGDSEDEDE